MPQTKKYPLGWEWWAPVIAPLCVGAFFWVFVPSGSSKIVAVVLASAGLAWALAACPYFPIRMPIRVPVGAGIFAVLAALSVWRLVSTVHTLVPHHPWDVRYGDVDGTGKDRIYVHARTDNTTRNIVTFEAYGKALLEPNPTSIALIQDPEIIEPLKDEVRRLASGGGNPTITAMPNSLLPATFDIPGPIIPREKFAAWKSGDMVLYYDAIVYEKLSEGMRYSFEECEIVRMLPVTILLPSGQSVQAPRQSNETPCNGRGD